MSLEVVPSFHGAIDTARPMELFAQMTSLADFCVFNPLFIYLVLSVCRTQRVSSLFETNLIVLKKFLGLG